MILKSARVLNYKSIDDSEEFSLEPITCLVGKNESGKSALLRALYKFNPIDNSDGEFDYLEEYPRKAVTDYEATHADDPAPVVVTTWELTDEDVKAVEGLIGPGNLIDRKVVIQKSYDNKLHWTLSIDFSGAISYYLSTVKLSSDISERLLKLNSLNKIMEDLEALAASSEQESVLLNTLREKFPHKTFTSATVNLLQLYLPKFVYFPEYERMKGKVAIDELIKKKNNGNLQFPDRIFLALLDLAGTSLEQIGGAAKLEQLIARLEGVSNRITTEIFRYWSQNRHLLVEFRFDAARPGDPPPFNTGYVFATRIRNTRHGVTVGFDERSTGFVWFFSFLIWLSQAEKNYGRNLVILLDEPGLSLHAKAQADLLKYIDEKLKPKYQIIYSTHSPFMVDPNNILNVRTVEDVFTADEVKGTKVGDRVLSTDADTVFPLQASLGFDITQTLFVGKHTLLVEGPSDLLYLKWFSNKLKTRGRTFLDPRWTIAPTGGIDKIASFVALFGGNKLNIAVLTDFHFGDKKKVNSLRESQLLLDGHVLSANSYTTQDEADIEDIIGRQFYLNLVNECYALPAEHKIPNDTKVSETKGLVLSTVVDHFRLLPPEIPNFDHYTPAVFLFENRGKFAKALGAKHIALDNFEKLFIDLNALLIK